MQNTSAIKFQHTEYSFRKKVNGVFKIEQV